MQGRNGMTLIETALSITIFTGLFATVLTSYITGQRSFYTSEAFLQSFRTARGAVDEVKTELANSQIYSYYQVFNGANGQGKTYVKFRRLDTVQDTLGGLGTDGLGNPIDVPDTFADLVGSNARPIWNTNAGQTFMYIWCTGAFFGQEPCSRLVPAPTAGLGQLVLAQTVGGPENDVAWNRVRVVATNVTRFIVTPIRADNGVVPMANGNCGSAGLTEDCVTPFGTTGLPAQVLIQVEVRKVAGGGQTAVSSVVPGRIRLSNPQN